MILRSLTVEGWRCFVKPTPLGPFADGLNVIHGPNGVGKSTLMGAMTRGFFDNHAVTGHAVRALQPWGRDLTPSVTLEFEHEEERYRLMKRFLSSPFSKLSRFEDGDFVPLAEGNAANERVRKVLAGEMPGKGVTDERHWGLAQVLWAPQRGMAIQHLSTGTAAAIQDSLGAQMAGLGGEALEAKISEAYSSVFTPSGTLRRGRHAPPVVGLEEQLTRQESKRQELLEKLEEFDQSSRRIQDLTSRRDQALRDQQQLEKDLQRARRRAEEYRQVLSQRDTQEQSVRAAEARHRQLQQRMDDIHRARKELGDIQQQVDTTQADAPLKLKEVEQCRQITGTAKSELEHVRTRREEVDAADSRSRRAASYVEQQRTLDDTDALIEKIDTARGQLDSLKGQRSGLVAPDAETLRSIQQAIKTRDDARVKLEAALITVSVVPDRDLQLEILTAEETGLQRVLVGQPCHIMGSPVVELRVPDVGTFRATGPTGSVEELRERIAEAETQIEALAEGFGTRNLDELRQLRGRADALDSEIAQAEAVLNTLLGDRPFEQIQQQRARSAKVVEEILAEHPQWAEESPDAGWLELEAKQIKESFVRDVHAAEGCWEKAEEAWSLARQTQAVHADRLRQLEQRVAQAQRRLEELTADGKDDDERKDELNQLALEWNAAKGLLEKANQDLAKFAGDPREEIEVLKQQLEQFEKQATDAAAQLHHEEGRLQRLASDAPYSALAEVEEAIDWLQKSTHGERLQNEAVRLLYETVSECRRSAIEAVAGPVEQMATQTLHRIAGGRLGRIEFAETLLPESVSPQAAGEPVAIDDVSGGEHEQIHFAVRLALANALFKDERQPFVLDDVFTFTDTARLARVLKILEEATEKFQILVFTCHPERYRGLPQADFFDLEEIVAASR